jgi:hypothetical protein
MPTTATSAAAPHLLQVWEAVSPRLAGDEETLQWLKENTRPLAEQKAAAKAQQQQLVAA